jgi:predicted nucleotidyltransferase
VAALGEQLMVAAVLDHAAVLQHQDLVGVDHGREAVRDDQRGAPGGQAPERRFSPKWPRVAAATSIAMVANGAGLDSTRPRPTWQHVRTMAASFETTTAGLEERQRVIEVLRRREHELRARGLTRLALFGSTARGDLGPKSDVDLLIEVDPECRFGLFAFLDLKDDLARLLSRPVDLAFADAMRPRLRAAVLQDAVEVF